MKRAYSKVWLVFFINLLLWVNANHIFSQSPNDDCAGAIPIVPTHQDSSCLTYNFLLAFNLTTQSGNPTNCIYFWRDQWFTWTATANALRFISMSPGQPSISMFQDCNAAALGNEIVCKNATQGMKSNLLYGWDIGDELLIQIHTNTVGTSMAFCLRLETQVPNDLCSGAIPIIPTPPDSGCAFARHILDFSSGVSDSEFDGLCGVQGSIEEWFFWIATTDALRYWPQYPGAPGIQIFEDCEKASSGQTIDCVMWTGNPKLLSGWDVGDTILLSIFTFDNDEVAFV